MIAAHACTLYFIRACLPMCYERRAPRSKVCAVRRRCVLPQADTAATSEGRHDEHFEPYCTSTVGTEQLPCAALNTPYNYSTAEKGAILCWTRLTHLLVLLQRVPVWRLPNPTSSQMTGRRAMTLTGTREVPRIHGSSQPRATPR